MHVDEPSEEAALAILGLRKGADRDTVWRAYRRLARESHPDVSGAPDTAGQFVELTRAYHRAVAAADAQPPETAIHVSVTDRVARPRAPRMARVELAEAFTDAVGRPWQAGPSSWDDGTWIVAGPVLVSPWQPPASKDPGT